MMVTHCYEHSDKERGWRHSFRGLGNCTMRRGLVDWGSGVSALRRGLLSWESGGGGGSCLIKRKRKSRHSRQKEQNVQEAEVGESSAYLRNWKGTSTTRAQWVRGPEGIAQNEVRKADMKRSKWSFSLTTRGFIKQEGNIRWFMC